MRMGDTSMGYWRKYPASLRNAVRPSRLAARITCMYFITAKNTSETGHARPFWKPCVEKESLQKLATRFPCIDIRFFETFNSDLR